MKMAPSAPSYANVASNDILPDRVFYREDGKIYKAKEASSPNHSECNFPTADMLAALTADAITREEMIAKINHPEFQRKEAVLATEVPIEKTIT
jgi:hypothetical protein